MSAQNTHLLGAKRVHNQKVKASDFLISNARYSYIYKQQGFSLLEVVLVLTVLCLIWSSISQFQGYSTSRRSFENTINSLWLLAKKISQKEHCTTRLLIHADPADPKHHSCYLMLLKRKGTYWEAIDKGHFLPPGVFWEPSSSSACTDYMLYGEEGLLHGSPLKWVYWEFVFGSPKRTGRTAFYKVSSGQRYLWNYEVDENGYLRAR